MGLNVWLEGEKILGTYICPTCGSECQDNRVKTFYIANITHNLNTMAEAAKLYLPLWNPEMINITKAKELIVILERGLRELERYPEYFKKYTPMNGWGSYDNLVEFVKNYLEACRKYPEAEVKVSR
jgi:hypothetical protein